MIGRLSELYVDNDGHICIDHTIDRNIALTWVLRNSGWEIYLGDICIYEFSNGVNTYPTSHMFFIIEDMISHFRYIAPSGMWEVSWMSEKDYCRKHLRFDEFEDALTAYQNLEKQGEL